jgi:phage portal protein BeeE
VASALERVNAAWATRGTGGDVERRFNIDGWVSDYLLPANQVTFGGNTYPFGLNQTFLGTRTQEISSTLPGYLAALRMCPPAFAAQMVRALVLSQARFIFRNNRTSRTPGRTFGSSALAPLETPWPNGTTGELLARMEWHAGLAGNAYVTNRQAGRLRVLRPDWVVIVYGSQQEPDDAAHALDGEILGYAYCNGGISQGRNRVITLLPDEVAHWAPLPDPESAAIGMSWITPAVREIQGDRAATDHKLQFFANGATPNLVVKGVTAASREQFDEIVDAMESKHAGIRNAYRTLYLAAGADASIVGSNLRDLDLKSINGSAETRISMLSRVHPTILGASEGLSGSSLNAGNFSSARRMWADSWIYPTLQDVAAALAPLIRVPSDAELWTTTADMPILREDAKDAADIQAVKATTINTLVTAGFTKASIVAAVEAQDMSLLVDSGLVSVQLQPPGSAPAGTPAIAAAPAEVGGAAGPKVPPALPTAARSADGDDDEPDEATAALIEALAWFDEPQDATRDAAFESKHHRGPGGRFATMVDRLINAIAEHKAGDGKGHPFDGFDREQLRRAAKARGIELKRGEDRDSIAAKLLADLGSPKPKAMKATVKKATKAVKPTSPARADVMKEEPLTRRDLEILQAKDQLTVLEARLKVAQPLAKIMIEARIRDARAKIDQVPGPQHYDWGSSSWADPVGTQITAGTVPAPGRIAEHVDTTVAKSLREPLRGTVVDVLKAQAEFVPRSVLNFRGVGSSREYRSSDKRLTSAWAYYEPGTRRAFLNPKNFDEPGRETTIGYWKAGHRSGYWSPTDATGPEGDVLSHEFGHHVAYRALAAPHDELSALADVFDEHLGLNGWLNTEFARTIDLPGSLDKLMPLQRGFAPGPNPPPYLKPSMVSEYAMTNHQELMAEIWAEYTTSKNPRPHIKAIGDAMRRAAERSVIIEQ